MKFIRRLLVVLFAINVMATSTHSAELIMFEQAGCDWCERWHEDIGVIYHKTIEGKTAPLRPIDIHEKLPDDLRNLKPGRFTPTFVLVNDGAEVGRIRGYPGEDFFGAFWARF